MGIERQLKKVIIPGLSALDLLETSFEFAEIKPHCDVMTRFVSLNYLLVVKNFFLEHL